MEAVFLLMNCDFSEEHDRDLVLNFIKMLSSVFENAQLQVGKMDIRWISMLYKVSFWRKTKDKLLPGWTQRNITDNCDVSMTNKPLSSWGHAVVTHTVHYSKMLLLARALWAQTVLLMLSLLGVRLCFCTSSNSWHNALYSRGLQSWLMCFSLCELMQLTSLTVLFLLLFFLKKIYLFIATLVYLMHTQLVRAAFLCVALIPPKTPMWLFLHYLVFCHLIHVVFIPF